jgi:hypothetical protein
VACTLLLHNSTIRAAFIKGIFISVFQLLPEGGGLAAEMHSAAHSVHLLMLSPTLSGRLPGRYPVFAAQLGINLGTASDARYGH